MANASFHASDASVCCARVIDDETLEVLGIPVGTASWVGSKASESSGIAPLQALQEWLDHAILNDPEMKIETFVRTIRRGIFRERFDMHYTVPSVAEAKQCLQEVLSGTRPLTPTDWPEIHGRSFFTATSGSCGLSAREIRTGDEAFVILGCSAPIVLRPSQEADNYEVIGPTYIDSLMDGGAVLGPTPPGWEIITDAFPRQYATFLYRNAKTGEIFEEDPRLGPLPAQWEPVKTMPTALDPVRLNRFRHVKENETLKGDPRLMPDARRSRGVQLKTLTLV